MPRGKHRRMGMVACRMPARAKIRYPEVSCHLYIVGAAVQGMAGAKYQV